jgi:hypothetical protein
VTYFARYRTPAIGFDTIAGRNDGLRRIVLAAGRLGASEVARCTCTTARRSCTYSQDPADVFGDLLNRG